MKARPVVIVLAAGRGQRFKGQAHKLTQPFGSASVLGTTLRHAVESHLPVVVVTTESLATEASRLIASRDIVHVPASGVDELRGGMGASIAAGVTSRPDASGWVILPADMPLVRPETIKAVADELARHPIAYAQHQGRRGHPVAFSCELYSELSQLTGDEGARRVVARYPSHGVEVDDPGVLIDIDTADDLAAHAARAGQAAPRAGKPAG